jgi:hypothetical protein
VTGTILRKTLPTLFLVFVFAGGARAQFTPPTDEELKMTSQPEVPGAAAVYLFREEITDDKLHSWSIYARIKVLTEKGKDLANVELRQYNSEDRGGYKVSDIQGRTIHPDGTIIPFTGKPFEKLIEKGQGYKETARVFTLPDVEVGSILEFRYVLRYDDDRFIAPSWFIQSEYYTRKAHYLWRPTDQQLITKNEHGEELTSTVAWAPILPKGVEVKQSRLTGGAYGPSQASVELNIQDVPPIPEEEYMPPIGSLTYRVLFYYSPYRTMEEFWKNEGKSWAKSTDKFVGPGPKVRDAVGQLVAASDTSDQKLRKLYAAVMEMDNSSFSREHSTAEDKAAGLNAPKSTDDIWERKRGTDDQLTELFVAMARAAGFKAYVMAVTDRDRRIFVPSFLSLSQLDDFIAIVNVDGKEQFFDPGQRYCAFGHLAWKHTFAEGIRQVDGGSAIADSPGESFKYSRIQRVANLTMDEHGEVTGTVKMTWIGEAALAWRQRALRGDEASVERQLRTTVERLLPGGMDIKVGPIAALKDYEQPFTVTFDVKGAIGSPTGKRLLLPVDLFLSNERPAFPHEKREIAVYFDYPYMVQDATRVNFPASFAVESVPASVQVPFQKFAVYSLTTESTATSVTTRREFDLGNIFYKLEEYPELRTFYTRLETKDQEPVVLKVGAAASGN